MFLGLILTVVTLGIGGQTYLGTAATSEARDARQTAQQADRKIEVEISERRALTEKVIGMDATLRRIDDRSQKIGDEIHELVGMHKRTPEK